MNFEELLCAAKWGDTDARERLFLMYRPLLLRYSMREGRFDEDLYQEQSMIFLKCVELFQPEVVKVHCGSDKSGTPMG